MVLKEIDLAIEKGQLVTQLVFHLGIIKKHLIIYRQQSYIPIQVNELYKGNDLLVVLLKFPSFVLLTRLH